MQKSSNVSGHMRMWKENVVHRFIEMDGGGQPSDFNLPSFLLPLGIYFKLSNCYPPHLTPSNQRSSSLFSILPNHFVFGYLIQFHWTAMLLNNNNHNISMLCCEHFQILLWFCNQYLCFYAYTHSHRWKDNVSQNTNTQTVSRITGIMR